MSGLHIAYNLANADPAVGNAVRHVGPADRPWSAFVLNGRGRSFHTRGAGSFSLKWMAKGRARYDLDRRPRTVSRAAAVIVDQDQPYEMEFDARTEGESYCLFFSRELVAQAWASVEAGFGEAGEAAVMRPFPNVTFAPAGRLASLLDGLEGEGQDADAAVLASRLMSVLEETVTIAHRHRRLAPRVPAAKATTQGHLLGLVEAARLRMVETSGVGLDLETLARDVGLSKFHLLRLFKAVHGATPIAYAERLRMQGAERRLRSGTAPIGQIATELGYESPSAFAKAFRRWTGSAPTLWRN